MPRVPATAAMHDEPKRGTQSSAQRTRRGHPRASGLDGDRGCQSGLPVARADDRDRVCRLQRTSWLTSFFGPWPRARPHGVGVRGAGAQSARVASLLKAEAECAGDQARKYSCVKPDALVSPRRGIVLSPGDMDEPDLPHITTREPQRVEGTLRHTPPTASCLSSPL